MQPESDKQDAEEKFLQRKSSINLDSKIATNLFNRIMVRLKIHKVIKHWKKLTKNSFNRFKRIQEWVITQKAYIQDLKLIEEKIEKPLKQKNLISEDEAKIIFPNILGIKMLSQQMYRTMKDFLDTWHPIKTEIAPAVIKLSNFFKIYIEYFNNYEKGKQILNRICDQSQYKAIQKTLKMDFESYLIKPTQRPVKYRLLLADYQKKLRKDHPDYAALTKAIEVYHEVVQKTNQALEQQRRTRRMVEMQTKFKNILQSSRQWKFQFEAMFEDNQHKSQVYVFTDLLLVVNLKGKKQELVLKMFLDATSFADARQDPYNDKRKKLFVTGKQLPAYFSFYTSDQRNRIFTELSKVINSLHVNQFKRKQAIQRYDSKRFSSTRFSKPFYVQDYYEVYGEYSSMKKKFRVTVVGVERRFFNKSKNQYFIIKLQLPFPQIINQLAFVTFQDLVDLENLLYQSMQKWALIKDQKVQPLKWRSVQELPKELAKPSEIQIDTTMIQYRTTRIQSFLNFVLRNKDTLKMANLILWKLKTFESIFETLINPKNQCEVCGICQNGEIISNYSAYQREMQSRIQIKDERRQYNYCTNRSFHTQNRLASQTKQNPRYTTDEALLYINSKQGQINQALTNRIIQGESQSIRIFRPCYEDLQNEKNQTRSKWADVNVYKRDTVGNVLQLIRKKMGLYSIKDYGLVLMGKDGVKHLLQEDQYIYDIINENDLNIEFSKPESENVQKSALRSFFSKIKQNFQSKAEEKNQKVPSWRIQLRKRFVFPPEIEGLTCSSDAVRTSLICDEIFYLFKSKDINLRHMDIVKLVSYFVCIEYNMSLRSFKKAEQISRSIIEKIIPSTRLNILSSTFYSQMWQTICMYKDKQIFDKQSFQYLLISLVCGNYGWNMQFFIIENLERNSFPGVFDKYLKIGVSWEYVVIVREGNNTLQLFKTPIDKLNAEFSGFLININHEERQYRFLCDNVFSFRAVLEKYLAFNKFFLGKDKTLGKSLMEETF